MIFLNASKENTAMEPMNAQQHSMIEIESPELLSMIAGGTNGQTDSSGDIIVSASEGTISVEDNN